MKLPTETLIDPKKLREYLLVKRKRNDKSQWLAEAGYKLENWEDMESDLREQILTREAIPAEIPNMAKSMKSGET